MNNLHNCIIANVEVGPGDFFQNSIVRLINNAHTNQFEVVLLEGFEAEQGVAYDAAFVSKKIWAESGGLDLSNGVIVFKIMLVPKGSWFSEVWLLPLDDKIEVEGFGPYLDALFVLFKEFLFFEVKTVDITKDDDAGEMA